MHKADLHNTFFCYGFYADVICATMCECCTICFITSEINRSMLQLHVSVGNVEIQIKI